MVVAQPDLLLLLSADAINLGVSEPTKKSTPISPSVSLADSKETFVLSCTTGDPQCVNGLSKRTGTAITIRCFESSADISGAPPTDLISSDLSDDTLSMISTPWSTESWSFTRDRIVSEDTVLPKSSSSYGITLFERNISSNTTITLVTKRDLQPSFPILVQNKKIAEEILSDASSKSESFNKTLTQSHTVRPVYPWSQNSYDDIETEYPSSSVTSRPTRHKVSKMTMTSKKYVNLISSMQYLILSTEQLEADLKLAKFAVKKKSKL